MPDHTPNRQGVAWCPNTGMNESIVIGMGGGGVHVILNMPADYWTTGRFGAPAVILALTTDGSFLPADPPPTRVLHVLGDSITAATNVRGGFPVRACWVGVVVCCTSDTAPT